MGLPRSQSDPTEKTQANIREYTDPYENRLAWSASQVDNEISHWPVSTEERNNDERSGPCIVDGSKIKEKPEEEYTYNPKSDKIVRRNWFGKHFRPYGAARRNLERFGSASSFMPSRPRMVTTPSNTPPSSQQAYQDMTPIEWHAVLHPFPPVTTMPFPSQGPYLQEQPPNMFSGPRAHVFDASQAHHYHRHPTNMGQPNAIQSDPNPHSSPPSEATMPRPSRRPPPGFFHPPPDFDPTPWAPDNSGVSIVSMDPRPDPSRRPPPEFFHPPPDFDPTPNAPDYPDPNGSIVRIGPHPSSIPSPPGGSTVGTSQPAPPQERPLTEPSLPHASSTGTALPSFSGHRSHQPMPLSLTHPGGSAVGASEPATHPQQLPETLPSASANSGQIPLTGTTLVPSSRGWSSPRDSWAGQY